jgi:enoyl-CoA hydratase/carnithine racemase
VLASFCDIRVAAENSFFAMPEIDRGVVAGGMFFQRLNMPQGMIREIIYTGRRLTAEEMRQAGFYSYVVPEKDVVPRAMEIANLIAKKNLFALQANKASLNESEVLGWEEAYHRSHEASAQLTASKDTKERIQAFFDKQDQHASRRK